MDSRGRAAATETAARHGRAAGRRRRRRRRSPVPAEHVGGQCGRDGRAPLPEGALVAYPQPHHGCAGRPDHGRRGKREISTSAAQRFDLTPLQVALAVVATRPH